MAGLAVLLKARGFAVSGCDTAPGERGAWLRTRGIPVETGHDPAHLDDLTAWVIRTPAVRDAEPEIACARRRGLPLHARGEVLPELLAGTPSVAVCGTHGKTTTASFLTRILQLAGREPGWCIGGECAALDGIAGAGGGTVTVAEADESDGTLAAYRPDWTVLTNVEFDHMEHFDDAAAFENCFRRVLTHTRRGVVFCGDDARAARLSAALPDACAYGFGPENAVRAEAVDEHADGCRFCLVLPGRRLPDCELTVPGRHNLLNALGAAAAADALGVAPEDIRGALPRLRLPDRRFERVTAPGGIRMISDYAHHPTEIAALVATARRQPHRRLRAVFQPHRYTRTAALGAAFPPAFEGVDELILVPVYAASEPPLRGGTLWDLYAHFRAAGQPPAVYGAEHLETARRYLAYTLREGDLLLVVGAGDVAQLAAPQHGAAPAAAPPPLAASLVRRNEPLDRRTTLRVGGRADWWVEAGSDSDLAALLRWAAAEGVPVYPFGGGSNVLVSDLGWRGVALRLGAPYRTLTPSGNELRAGAAVTGARLLDGLETRGLANLEFLEGVPGTVGGMLRMNAGAHGHCILEHVAWIRCLNRDGEACIVRGEELEWAYRRCPALEERIILEAAFTVEQDAPQRIAKRRAALAERRAWMKALPGGSAGSVFRNPPGQPAGRLLEQAGVKGLRIGGAAVSERHANVVVTAAGARASDVRALVHAMQAAVVEHGGVSLEPEVVRLGF